MGIVIETIGADRLAAYAGVSIEFDVRSALTIDEVVSEYDGRQFTLEDSQHLR